MKSSEVLLLGIGTAGSRAICYLSTRGDLAGTQMLAADTDGEALALLQQVETIKMPDPDSVYAQPNVFSEEGQKFFVNLLNRMRSIKLLVLVTCLGRRTGNFYAPAIAKFAKDNLMKVAVISAMPHSFDDAEWHVSAKSVLDELNNLADAVLPLPCCEFGALFPDQERNEAYPQAARWIAETAIGFVAMFISVPIGRGKTMVRSAKKPNQLRTAGTFQPILEFKEMPLGIFAVYAPSTYNGTNLDIPTYLRNGIMIDDGSSE